VRPIDLAKYLRARSGELAEAWAAEIGQRGLGQGSGIDRVVGRFMSQLTAMLPWLLGPHGSHVQPLWDRTAELFGVMAAKRGLAAGEVMEEFQILRDLLIRTIYKDPPAEGLLSLRDTLRLNRIVDRGVTHASVGHTDAMFFELFERKDVDSVTPTPDELAREAEAQLDAVRNELGQIVETTAYGPEETQLRN
jgi:hypothetical protein